MSEESKSNASDTPAPIGEIEHGPSKFEVFMEKNVKKLILLALLIVIGVAAFVIVSQLGDAKQREAGNALIAAEDPEAYRKVAADYPNSPSASSAKLLLAGQLLDEGKEDEAVKTLKTLADGEGSTAQQAQFALAGIHLKQGNSDKAKAAYESLLSNSEAKYLHPLSLVALGDIAKAAGEDEKASSYYQRKIDDYKDFALGNLAANRLNLVGVDEATKVPPPPPAPTPQPGALPNTGLSPAFTPPVGLPSEPGLPPIQINSAELTPPIEAKNVVTEDSPPSEEVDTAPEAEEAADEDAPASTEETPAEPAEEQSTPTTEDSTPVEEAPSEADDAE